MILLFTSLHFMCQILLLTTTTLRVGDEEIDLQDKCSTNNKLSKQKVDGAWWNEKIMPLLFCWAYSAHNTLKARLCTQSFRKRISLYGSADIPCPGWGMLDQQRVTQIAPNRSQHQVWPTSYENDICLLAVHDP